MHKTAIPPQKGFFALMKYMRAERNAESAIASEGAKRYTLNTLMR